MDKNNQNLNCPIFTLTDKITPEQITYFNQHGFIKFNNFITESTVKLILEEVFRIEKKWLAEGRNKINGIPLKFGKDEYGNKTIQRFCFLSKESNLLHNLLKDPRLQTLTELLHPYEGRIGEDEKDGLVLNNYIRIPNSSFTQMGWHTDCPRDFFLGQKMMPMLNVGIHLDNCPFENGGLRVLPGTHKQNMLYLLFSKKYFIDHTPDPKEVGFDINAGDLTVHDGRIWHRVEQSPNYGEKSRRRVMYVPITTGKYNPKSENSTTPFYHWFTQKVHR